MQNTLSREIIHKDFHHMPMDMKRDEFFVRINRAKQQLLDWGFERDTMCVHHLMSNTVNCLAFQFACLELGIGIAVPPEAFFDTPESGASEHWKRIDREFRQFVRVNNRFPIQYTVDDRQDVILTNIEKNQIYGKIYMDTTEEFGVKHGNYMGVIQDKVWKGTDEDVQPWEVRADTCAWGGFKTGSGWGYTDFENKIETTDLSWNKMVFQISHEGMLDKMWSTPLDMRGKVVGLPKTLLHHNALERHVLPAIMQSGRIVDMPIPEYNLGNTFIEGIELNGKEITKEMVYQFVCANACHAMQKFKVDSFSSPSDEALFAWLDIYNTTRGDFDRPVECLIHTEPTQEHLDWESKMSIKFVYDGEEMQYGHLTSYMDCDIL